MIRTQSWLFSEDILHRNSHFFLKLDRWHLMYAHALAHIVNFLINSHQLPIARQIFETASRRNRSTTAK
jgi:hypothetical protein